MGTRKPAGRWNVSKSRRGSQIDKEKKEKKTSFEQPVIFYIASVLNGAIVPLFRNARAVEQARIWAGV